VFILSSDIIGKCVPVAFCADAILVKINMRGESIEITLILLYSSCTLHYFPLISLNNAKNFTCILRIRRKNGENAERNFYFQQCLSK